MGLPRVPCQFGDGITSLAPRKGAICHSSRMPPGRKLVIPPSKWGGGSSQGFELALQTTERPWLAAPTQDVLPRSGRLLCRLQTGGSVSCEVHQYGQNWGHLFGCPHNKDYSILGPTFGSPYLGNFILQTATHDYPTCSKKYHLED